MIRTLTVATMCVCAVCASASAVTVGPGGPNYDSINGLLSDFQQSYGQVVGNEVTLTCDGQIITSLTVYGLYYNYVDMTFFKAPIADNFTLRLHDVDVVSGDPEEAFSYELNIGAGIRTDTGEDYSGLTIYQYDFANLNIPIGSGTTLLSIIDDTIEPAVNGYWHWVSANDDDPDDTWWRREDSQPVGEENTFYWTSYSGFLGDRAFSLEVVPEPLTMLAVFAGLAGLGGYIRRRRVA